MTGFVPNPGQPDVRTTGFVPSGPPAPGIGGAVGSFFGSSMSKQAIDRTKGEAQKLTDAANSGGFSISPEGADAYIAAFDRFDEAIASIQTSLMGAKQIPRLGDSPYAQAVSRHTQMTASGDEKSYETALLSLQEIVGQAREAFIKAKEKYAEMDADAEQTFKPLNSEA
ncbi:hypothetical protein CFN78_10265 [Amycolatopsis antarctica]|uniref:PE domain-containing protein n=1 Tax=Amycolatopsis antarctica TaxID=1854586 RepID=A0A263D4E7_9PSEU|nr:hypothetical protein [Amycolatopsis antarctica]OZM73241.1 hypothetical protein CFN78_10265 [Amycolatopsis antarctica]